MPLLSHPVCRGRFVNACRALLLSLFAIFALPLGSSGQSTSIRLHGHVPIAAVTHATMLDALPAGARMSLAITLPLRNQDELSSLLQRLYDPGDPQFGRYLSSQQFADRFGPTEADYNAVIEFARVNGLTVVQTWPNRAIVDVSGPAGAIEKAFGVHINRYRTLDGRVFHAPDSEPEVPAEIAGRISGIAGLDDAEAWRPHSHIVPGYAALPHGLLPMGSAPDGGLAPADIRTAYNLTSVTQPGAGQTLALVELDGYTASDITTYETTFGLPNTPLQNILVDGATGAPSSGSGPGEVTLDIEVMLALAPRAGKILVYEAPNTLSAMLDMLNRIATDNTARQISTSWGLPETHNHSTVAAENTVFQQMAAQGQSIFAAAGDSGAYDDGAAITVDDPASQPFMTAVGGSDLFTNSDYTYNHEITWGSSPLPDPSGGGGGISTIWPKPAYQSGRGSSSSFRNVPDVSLDAGPVAPYAVYLGGSWTRMYGTSAAAPLWAAFAALVNQRRAASALPALGFANSGIYSIGGSSRYGADFHDIADNSTNLYYAAISGYDDATGWGTFNGASLLTDLSAPAPSAPSGLTAAINLTTATLSWTPTDGAYSYIVKRSTTTGGPYSNVASVTTPAYVDSNLTNLTIYYYVVSAVSTGGESGNSAQVGVAVHLAIPPPPTHLAAAPDFEQVTLTWWSSDNAASYNIKRSTVNGGPYATIDNNTNPICFDRNVVNGTIYYYVVSAINKYGESSNTAPVSAVPNYQIPGIPTWLTTSYTGSSINLSWSRVNDANYYILKRSMTSGGPYDVRLYPLSSDYVDNSVGYGSTYYYVVAGVNDLYTGPYSAEAKVTAGPPIPVPPTNLTAVSGYECVALTWTASANGADLYSIRRSSVSGGPYAQIDTTSSTSFTDIVGNGKTYYYVVAGHSVSGWGANSPEVSATASAVVPAPPGNVASESRNGSVVVTWLPTLGATTYNLKRATVAGGPYTTAMTGPYTGMIDYGVSNFTTYYYVVTAENPAGQGPNSMEVSATPFGIPAAPIGLTATPGSAAVDLNWTGMPGITNYNVQRATVSGGPYTTIFTTPGSPSGSDHNVTNNVTYYYVVSGKTSAGEGPVSNEVFATPNLTKPELTVSPGNGQIHYLIGHVPGATGYNIYRSLNPGGEGSTPYLSNLPPSATGYVDSPVTNGVAYYYQATAIGTTPASPKSSERVAIPIATAKTDVGPAIDPANPLTAGLVLCAPISDGSGSVITNIIDGATAAIGAGWQWNSNSEGFGLSGDGTQPPLFFAPTVVPTGDLSIFISGGVTGSGYFAQDQDGLSSGAWGVAIDSTGSHIFTTSQTDIPASLSGTLKHIGLTRSGHAETLYVNGVQSGVATDSGAQIRISGPHHWAIGGAKNSTSPNANGMIGFLCVWNRALTAVEMAQMDADPFSLLVRVPNAPGGLMATPGNSQVQLSWSAVSGVTGYNIFVRSIDQNNPVSIATVAGTSFTHSGLINGNLYRYTVAGVNRGVQGPVSPEVSAIRLGRHQHPSVCRRPPAILRSHSPGLSRQMPPATP